MKVHELIAYDADGARYCLDCARKAGIDTSEDKSASGYGGPVLVADLDGPEYCSDCREPIPGKGAPMPSRFPPLPATVRCSPKCPGWLHMDDPCEVQACDACGRFDREDPAAFIEADGTPRPGIVTDDGIAREAHARECGCSWGEEEEEEEEEEECGNPECPSYVADLYNLAHRCNQCARNGKL